MHPLPPECGNLPWHCITLPTGIFPGLFDNNIKKALWLKVGAFQIDFFCRYENDMRLISLNKCVIVPGSVEYKMFV